MSLYKCPKCNLQLIKIDRTYKCSNSHSYDISKKGYVNLMLANQGHSLLEGDSKTMIDARTRFLNDGFYKPLQEKLYNIIYSLINKNDHTYFLDAACGEGYYTNFIHQNISFTNIIDTYGIDISKSAINAASSIKNINKLQNINYSVGNLDYLPFLNNSFSILLNCFAPINILEFSRVLKKEGYFIRVLPGKFHLYELKEFLYEEIHLNAPKDDNLNDFILENEYQVDDFIHLNNSQIQDLFTMTPYYYKTSYEAKERLKSLTSLSTRISFIIKVYKKD